MPATKPEVAGERVITESGSVTNYYRIYRKGSDTYGTITSNYAPAPVIQSITTNPTVFRRSCKTPETFSIIGVGRSFTGKGLLEIKIQGIET